jgi:hypothetical protein
MGKLFAPNITRGGRVVRAIWGIALIIIGGMLFSRTRLVSILLFVAGAFSLFEAVRGWCVMRACGIKTKI